MHRLVIAATLSTALACGHAAPSPAPSPTPSPPAVETVEGAHTADCAYGFQMLQELSSPDAIHSAAAVEADRASTLLAAGDPLTAARRYLACAATYREAADADVTAAGNAQVCYYNAAYAFATAGAYRSEGAAALEAAAAEDPRRAGYIRDQLLAHPPTDCR